ncbi:MAG TPA: capsule assembly Wzi family protein [Longimicrobium sp.]|nr:capsule assembly Wzi family protein [Longimicrobium sp.]
MRILPPLLALVLAAVPSFLSAQASTAPSDAAPPPAPPAADAAGMDTAAPGPAAAASTLLQPLNTAGGAQDEALRAAQLRGEAPSTGYLLRSPSTFAPGGSGGPARVWIVAPEAELGWNSDIPFGLNDGALWSGRGSNLLLRAGVGVQAGPVRLIVAPELTWSANAAFDSLIPPAWAAMDSAAYLPPWQVGEHSIDLPYRMGDGSLGQVRPGQSSLTVTAGPVAVGAATENEWWGPGIRNALLLSNQAAGFGHLFVRTARPLRTPVGQVEARWISGALRDSEWYARERGTARGWRSLSAAALVVSPWRTLSLGLARTVHTPADGAGDALAGGARVFTRWKEEGDPVDPDRYEQITALWGRVVVPQQGAEFYVEWARTRLPINTRALLETPEHTQGYTLGLQWLRPAGSGEIRLQAEHTYVEESPTFAFLYQGSWYASRTVPQGYTHEGQVLGASVGPGASGQWLAVDWLRGRGRGGAFVGRIRWAEDAYYDKPGGPNTFLGHDVSMMGGLRGAIAVGPLRLDAEYTLQKRYNYLFQSEATAFSNRNLTQNVLNHTLRLGVSTAAPRLGPARR